MQANLWTDEQKSHMRLFAGVRLLCKSKPDNYTELRRVDAAVTWSERNVCYSGRSLRYAPKGVSTVQGKQGGVERKEVSRGNSSREVKDRINRSS